MGEYKVIYEIVAQTMKQLQEIADQHGLSAEEQIEFFEDMKASINDDIDAKVLKLQTKPSIKTKLQILEDELNKFDYYFEYSDDNRVWRAGLREKERIQAFINSLPPGDLAEAQEIVDFYQKENGISFSVPLPESIDEVEEDELY